MAGSTMQLEVVAADRLVWSGEAQMVLTRTTDGEIGILPHHTPVLSVLVSGTVEVTGEHGDRWAAAVDGGFLSVAANRVSILAEHAELADDIDVEQARRDLDQAGSDDDDQASAHARTWAQARIDTAERG